MLYRPPHLVKDFILELTELMGYITTNYDRFILVGDFNVHVCCPSNSLSKEFLKGSYDVAKKNIILCIWCNAMCLCGLRGLGVWASGVFWGPG